MLLSSLLSRNMNSSLTLAVVIQGGAVSDLIDSLCLQMKYRAHLEANGPDWRERWENIVELKSFACIVADENPEGVAARDMLMSDDMDEETRREMGNDSGFEELAKTYE